MTDLVFEIAAGISPGSLMYEVSLCFKEKNAVRTYDQFREPYQAIASVRSFSEGFENPNVILRMVPFIELKYKETEIYHRKHSRFPVYTKVPNHDFRNIASEFGFGFEG